MTRDHTNATFLKVDKLVSMETRGAWTITFASGGDTMLHLYLPIDQTISGMRMVPAL